MFCAEFGGRKDHLLKKPKLSPEASFELQPTKRQKHSFHLRLPSNYRRPKHQQHSFHLRLPSNYSRQNVKHTILQTYKTQLSPEASFELQLSPEASFELQLRLPSNYRRPKRQKHSFHLRLPSNYSSKLPSNYSRQNPKTQLSPEAS